MTTVERAPLDAVLAQILARALVAEVRAEAEQHRAGDVDHDDDHGGGDVIAEQPA